MAFVGIYNELCCHGSHGKSIGVFECGVGTKDSKGETFLALVWLQLVMSWTNCIDQLVIGLGSSTTSDGCISG